MISMHVSILKEFLHKIYLFVIFVIDHQDIKWIILGGNLFKIMVPPATVDANFFRLLKLSAPSWLRIPGNISAISENREYKG
jgi:hypothetical protein